MPGQPDVVVVNDYGDTPGGSTSVARMTARLLADAGHAVTYFSAVPCSGSPLSGIRTLDCGQHEVLNDPRRLRAMAQGIWNRRAAALLKAELATHDPRNTIVHLHGWSKALSGSVVRAATDAGYRLVLSLHDYFVACPNGGFYDYPTGDVCGLRPMSAACVLRNCDSRSYPHKLWRVVRQAAQDRFGRIPSAIDHFIAPSALAARKLRPYLSPAACVHILPTPTGRALARPLPASERSGVVFVGRLSAEKGVDVYAEACRRLSIPVEFVGEGPMRSWLEQHYPEARVSGWLSASDVHQRMARSLAVVSPSRCLETQGLVVDEAAALGVAAIVAAGSASAERVRDGVDGLYARMGDADSFAEAMRRVLADPDWACLLGARAQEAMNHRRPAGAEEYYVELRAIYAQALAQRVSASEGQDD